MLLVEFRHVQRKAFQLGPRDHAEVFRPVLRQIEDVTHELGYRIGAQLHSAEKFRAVGGDDVAEERLLVAEMRIEPFLARAGGAGDAIDARPGQAVLSELRAGGGKYLTAELRPGPHGYSIVRRTSSFGMVVKERADDMRRRGRDGCNRSA